jgi:hypothetical protein
MPSPEERPSQRPAYGPVRLTRLDPQAVREMKMLIRRATLFSREVIGFEHGYPIAQLAEAIGDRIVSGEAPDGLEIDDLCQGRTASGRIRDGFGEEMRDLVDLAVRTLFFFGRRYALYGHITSIPVSVGRDSQAIGVDSHPGVGPRAHILIGALGSADRILISQGRWLLTGTRDDHSSPRADPERIARFSLELGDRLPGSIEEHLARQFEAEDRTERVVEAAAEKNHSAFGNAWLDPSKVSAYGFPKCLIIDSILHAPPSKRGQTSGGELYPGNSEAVVEAILSAKRYGIVRCELPDTEVPLTSLEDDLLPALEECYRERRKPLPTHLEDQIVNWNRAHELQVGQNLRLVRYWWFEEAGILLRSIQLTGVDEGEILSVSLWRIVGLDHANLRAAVVLTERAEQSLARICLTRYRHETEIGLMKPWKAPYREGLLVASLLPNAAGVTAHREMELRQERF